MRDKEGYIDKLKGRECSQRALYRKVVGEIKAERERHRKTKGNKEAKRKREKEREREREKERKSEHILYSTLTEDLRLKYCCISSCTPFNSIFTSSVSEWL